MTSLSTTEAHDSRLGGPATEVFSLAPGYHVSFLASPAGAAAPFDLIEVVATHPGGPAAQRHEGTTWFHVLEGHLKILEDRHRLHPSIRLAPGQTHAVPAGVAHTAHNAGDDPVRFLIGGQPGTISSYLAQFDQMRPRPRA